MKKLLLVASGLFLAATLYIGVNSYKNINSETDLFLANIEALARGETDLLGTLVSNQAGNYFCCLQEGYRDCSGNVFCD